MQQTEIFLLAKYRVHKYCKIFKKKKKMIFLIKKNFSSKNEIYIIKVRIRTFSQLTIKTFSIISYDY